MVKGFLNLCGFLGLLSIVAYIFSVVSGIFGYIFKRKKDGNFFNVFLSPIIYLINSVKGLEKKEIGEKIGGYIICLMIVIGVIWAPLSFFYKEEKIGSIFEKTEYRTQYYVNLFPEDSNSKNYRVKADIYSVLNSYSYTDGDSERTVSNREYYITRAYFTNGGSISFEDSVGSGDSLIVGKKEYLVDDDKGEWYVELTNEKVKQ
jgi:hypothetical protein